MRNRHLLLLTAALALTLGLGACGSDSGDVATGSGSGSDSAADPAGPGEAALAYSACMREEGIEDFPDPEIGDDGSVRIGGGAMNLDDPALAAAEEACRALLEEGGSFEQPDPERAAEMEAQVLAFAECMREHGIDFPDPQVDGGRVMMRPGEGVDPESPEFTEAQEACEGEMPDGGPGGPGAGGQP